MRVYDISLTISPDMPVWPGDPQVSLERVAKIEDGANANVTRLSMSAHTGTHVDAPYHFLGGSTPTVESLPLNYLTGRVIVLQVPDEVDLITADVLRKLDFPLRTRRVIIKTRNSRLWERGERTFQKDFVALSADAAEYLVNKGLKLIGIDYLSIAPFGEGLAAHRTLLEAGIVILEGVDLSQVGPGRYTLYCLPLKLQGSDGAPARVLLIS